MRSLLRRSLRKVWRIARGEAPLKLGGSAPRRDERAGHASILIVDDYVPFFDRSAGGKRMFELIKIMRELGFAVTFASDEGLAYEPYTRQMQELGINVISGDGVRSAAGHADIIWLSRPQIAGKYLPRLERPAGKHVIFDTVDLHYRRLRSNSMRELELRLAQSADRTVVTTQEERLILQEAGITNVCVVPVVTTAPAQRPGTQQREGLLFLGNYMHAPNVEAAAFLCTQILPLVRAKLPSVKVTLAGAEPTAKIRALANENVNVTGYVSDLTALFDSHRLFVAPLRTGAGLKGKIIEALAHGLPVITSAIGAEGMQLEHGRSVLLAENAQDFAAAVVQAYDETRLWETLSNNGLEVARRFTPHAVLGMVRDALDFDEPRKRRPLADD